MIILGKNTGALSLAWKMLSEEDSHLVDTKFAGNPGMTKPT
jgi:hypothetical protein